MEFTLELLMRADTRGSWHHLPYLTHIASLRIRHTVEISVTKEVTHRISNAKK